MSNIQDLARSILAAGQNKTRQVYNRYVNPNSETVKQAQQQLAEQMAYRQRNDNLVPAFVPIAQQLSQKYPAIPETVGKAVSTVASINPLTKLLPGGADTVGNVAKSIITTPQGILDANQKLFNREDLTEGDKKALKNYNIGLVAGITSPLKNVSDPNLRIAKSVIEKQAPTTYKLTLPDGKVIDGLTKQDAADWSSSLQGKNFTLEVDVPAQQPLKIQPGETIGEFQLRTQAASGKQLLTDFDVAQRAGDQKAIKSIAQQIVDSPDPAYASVKDAFRRYLDPLEALKAEARKYKSAEEFIQAQGQPLYHGSKAKFNAFDSKKFSTGEGADKFGQGAYLTDSESLADFYANVVAKKDFVEKYTPTGIFGTEEPVYKAGADQLAKKNAVVNKFVGKNLKLLDADTFKVDDDLIDAFTKSYTDRGYTKDFAKSEIDRLIYNARKNGSNINNFRGELDYLISQVTEGDAKATNNVIDIIKKRGYDGIKYASDKSYEGGGSYNYVIYNPQKLLSESQLTDIYTQATAPVKADQLNLLKQARDAGDLTAETAITDRIRTGTVNGQQAKKSLLQISEDGGGWKPGQQREFNTALLKGDAETIKRLLPDVPQEYKDRFSNELLQYYIK